MTATHVFGTPPEGVAADWTMPQNWFQFSDVEHATWDLLFSRQAKAMDGLACRSFLAGLDILRLSNRGIPVFEDLGTRLKAATGWTIVAVPGVIPNNAFFGLLANRRFPVANFLRSPDALEYCDEPDMFHDLFGHIPMLADPTFAEFLVAYGNAGLRAERLDAAGFLGRLYLHTVEFGLVIEDGILRAFGAGMLSSYAEALHAVSAPGVRRIRFDLERAMRTEYVFDEFQKTYFVIDSFEDLRRTADNTDFAPIYDRLRTLPLLEPDARFESDVDFEANFTAA